MISRWLASGFSGAIRLLTGARALWRCAPSSDHRVYYGNHVSHGDFVMIWSALPPALRREVRPVAGADYWQRDALRRYLIREVFNGVLIERDPAQRKRDAIETLCEAVDEGCSLILFPEGTRNQSDEPLLPFKSGLYHLAHRRPELEFVPVWIDNLARVMPKGKLLPLPLLCTATFGDTLRLGPDEDKQQFLERARNALLALSGHAHAHDHGGEGGVRMIELLRGLPHSLLLFIGVAAVLLVATAIAEYLRWRTRERPSAVIANLVARIRAWWVMALVVGLAFVVGRVGMIVLFALVSLFALREFITLTPTRRSDYYALLAAFYLALPLQYWLVYTDWYGLYTLLIPVYAFLLLPILATVGGDTTRYLERTAKVQWGLMICVFCISHVPALINLRIPGYEGRNLLLIAFLVIVVQSSDVLQYVWGKLCGKRLIAPKLSPSKTVEGFVGGVASATALGAALWWITPFTPWQAAALALVINLMGFYGGLVMSAIKRDRGIKDWGHMIEGHGGVLDRLDSVCFAAPVFFHLIRYWWV